MTELTTLSQLQGWTPYPHQIETAKRVLFEMNGRALIADEVGLGKTIEAGLIASEMHHRGILKKALILVPSSLVFQWARELHSKFGLPVTVFRKSYMWDYCPIVIASLETAKRGMHRLLILQQTYDLLIIDEAHKLKNPASTNHKFVRDISSRNCILLTATPLQNEITELHHLISLVQPETQQNEKNFRANFQSGKRGIKNEERLREQLTTVLVRNRRVDAGLNLPDRTVEQIQVRLSSAELTLYEAVSDWVAKRAKTLQSKREQLTLMMIQREVCSSRDALFLTLVKWYGQLEAHQELRNEIWPLIQAIKEVRRSSKSNALLPILSKNNEKTVIFTAFRATQEHIIAHLQANGISAVAFYGKMNRGKRDWMIDLFKNRVQVLVATDAGSEGLNLQFCRNVLNYDLPWNPMRLEQRIGRVHRIGQTEPVRVTHLVVENSIEAYILNVLSEKTKMIESLFGKGDPVVHQWYKEWLSWRTLQQTSRSASHG